MARLRRSDCSSPGILRRRRGRGFQYLDPQARPVEDPQLLRRIQELRIPPAWREVWVCPDPLGHLQATGMDAAGRKQYLYHERWRAHRDRRKFDTMVAFARALPRLRRRIAREIAGSEPTRERVLACTARMLDLGFFRVGSEDYAEQNGSYGLATMLKRHVRVEGSALVFDYPAKSGQRRVQAIVDADVLQVVCALKRRRGGGPELFAYRAARRWVDVRSEDINSYLKDAMGADFTAKDFRTWNATVLAAVALAAKPTTGAGSAERAVSGAVRTVAAYLGNTPAVCRSAYIDPRVIDRFRAGATIAPALERSAANGPDLADARVRRRVEAAVLGLLDA